MRLFFTDGCYILERGKVGSQYGGLGVIGDSSWQIKISMQSASQVRISGHDQKTHEQGPSHP